MIISPSMTFRFKRSSTLPRRTFHVDVTVNGEPCATTVTAPDAVAAEAVVRAALTTREDVTSFSFDFMREVITDWERKVTVRVPDTFRHAVTVPEPPRPVHTIRGKPIGPEGSAYGVTHDMDCPGCRDIPFTLSPRSETYWCS
jgi:hypothetical protein